MGIVLEEGCLIRAMQRSELHEFPQSLTFKNGCKFYLVEFLNCSVDLRVLSFLGISLASFLLDLFSARPVWAEDLKADGLHYRLVNIQCNKCHSPDLASMSCAL